MATYSTIVDGLIHKLPLVDQSEQIENQNSDSLTKVRDFQGNMMEFEASKNGFKQRYEYHLELLEQFIMFENLVVLVTNGIANNILTLSKGTDYVPKLARWDWLRKRIPTTKPNWFQQEYAKDSLECTKIVENFVLMDEWFPILEITVANILRLELNAVDANRVDRRMSQEELISTILGKIVEDLNYVNAMTFLPVKAVKMATLPNSTLDPDLIGVVIDHFLRVRVLLLAFCNGTAGSFVPNDKIYHYRFQQARRSQIGMYYDD